jgi:hypothetical protein
VSSTIYRPPTDVEVEAMVADAYQQGVDEAYTDETGTDWDRLLALYEVGEIDLGNDSDSSVIRRVRAAYRRGRRESEG